MKIIKTFEEWSPKFNSTLQGAAALATSTNKPNQKKQSIVDYANRSISKELFEFRKIKDGKLETVVFSISHDPEFILKPIEKFSVLGGGTGFRIPVILKSIKSQNLAIESREEKYNFNFVNNGKMYINSFGSYWDPNSPGNEIKFVDRSSIENLMAMAIQAIESSPEKGTGITKEDILDIIKDIVLDKDMRSFTI